MQHLKSLNTKPFIWLPSLGLMMLLGIWLLSVSGRSLAGSGKQEEQDKKAPSALADLTRQIKALKLKVMHLENALQKTSPPMPPKSTQGMGQMGMGMMQGRGMMGMMSSKSGQSSGGRGSGMTQMMDMMQMMMQMKMMQMQDSMAGMGAKSGGMGMKMVGGHGMGMMGGTHANGRMQTSSALPGFPGASHIYHVGATGYFLDHPQHITLTKEQQTSLNRIKETSLLQQESSQRKIDEAEKELFVLTGSDKPDASKIEVKVREIEKLKGDKRLAFIRSVGNAAKVLTQEQREALLGFISPKTDKPSSSSKPESSGKDKAK